jgi:hypothetical protein
MAMKSYDSNSILVTLGGTPIDGFAEGSRVTATPGSKRWLKKVGSNGEVVRQKTNDKSYTFKFSLMRTSLSNTYLTGLVNTDDLIPGGITHPLLIKDLVSGTTYSAKNAWVTGFPEDEMGAESPTLEWEIDAGETLVDLKGTL